MKQAKAEKFKVVVKTNNNANQRKIIISKIIVKRAMQNA